MTKLFGLPIHYVNSWIFNSYVWEDQHTGGGLAVFDPGLPMLAKQVVALTRELDRDPQHIRAVACTHGHTDHVGGVSTLLAHSGDHRPSVALPARCEQYLNGTSPSEVRIAETAALMMPVYAEQPFSLASALDYNNIKNRVGYGSIDTFTIDFLPTDFVNHDDAVPGAPGWEVIHAPGHSDDSTVYYHRDTATMMSGDAVLTQNGRAWFNPAYTSHAVAAETEALLRSYEVQHLLPGHGTPISAPDVWATARSATEPPTGNRFFARCVRRFGKWGAPRR